ncbi:MAG: choice-of-anchor tandem repeat GloVer-containing protein [Bryobacteraceae bacterium]
MLGDTGAPYFVNKLVEPESGVVFDAAGNLYGTTLYGGRLSYGVVYKIDPSRNATVLYAFSGRGDGGSTRAGVILDSAGNLYGTTTLAGSTKRASSTSSYRRRKRFPARLPPREPASMERP